MDVGARIQSQVDRANAFINTSSYCPPVFDVYDAPLRPVSLRKPGTQTFNWSYPPRLLVQRFEGEGAPIPKGFWASPGTDREAVIRNTGPGRDYYEFWKISLATDGSASAYWGGAADLSELIVDPKTKCRVWPHGMSLQATGLTMIPGLIFPEDVQLGKIPATPVHFALGECTKGKYRPPAIKTDGRSTAVTAVDQGTWVGLPADLDVTKLGLSKLGVWLARVAQGPGFVLTDTNGGGVTFRGVNVGASAREVWATAYGKPAAEAWSWKWYPDKTHLLKGWPWARLIDRNPTA